MTKNILAIAIAAAVMAPSAFAAATVYGVAHMSVNSFSSVSDGATAPSSTGLTSIGSNSSRLGIKGSEDLGGGMSAVYQMEMAVAMDGNLDGAVANGGTPGVGSVAVSGNNGLNANNAAIGATLRNTFVGLGGGFGTVLVGRHDSLIKLTGRKYDLFDDKIGNNRSVLGYAAGLTAGNNVTVGNFVVDGRHNNVLAYISPTWSGFHFGAAYVPSSAATGAETYDSAVNKQAALTALADYTVGNFSTTLGYINIDGASNLNPTVTGATAFTAYRLGAGYSFGSAKVVGLYQTAKIVTSSDAYGLGGSYKVGAAGTIKGQYYIANNSNAAGNQQGGTLTTVGYDHALSKNTTAYAVYSLAHNNGDTATGGTMTTDMTGSGAGSNVNAMTGKDNSVIAVGLIHNF
jgi:predicted porin